MNSQETSECQSLFIGTGLFGRVWRQTSSFSLTVLAKPKGENTMKGINRSWMKMRVACVLAIAAVLALAITGLWPRPVRAAQFMSGPSVQVIPTVQVESTWTTDVAWFGEV